MQQQQERSGEKRQVYKNYIGGKWLASKSGETFQVRNPARTSQVLGSFQLSTADDVHDAVDAAKTALGKWSNTPTHQRGRFLHRAADVLEEEMESLARTLTMEEGKTLKESQGEVQRAVEIFRFYAGLAPIIGGKTLPSSHERTFIYTRREPIGVVGVMTPWNFPIAIPAWKMAPALVCGDPVVFKPASNTPLIATRLVESLDHAGLPPGVLNLVTGPGGSVGEALCKSPEIDAISFTGSTQVGRKIGKMTSEGQKMVRVQLELGGKNPAIVLPDARLDQVVPLIKTSAFGLTGQACTATSRLIVHESLKDKLVKKIAEEASNIKVGDGLQAGVEMGPAVSDDQLKKDLDYVRIGKNEGAKLVVGGDDKPGKSREGHFVKPAVFDDVQPDMKIAQEEIFGPVLSVITANSVEEAVEIANATGYGLTAGVYTSNLTNAIEFANRVEAGVIKVNLTTTGLEYQVPYGGFKQSSAQTFKEQGTEAIDFYTRIKSVYLAF